MFCVPRMLIKIFAGWFLVSGSLLEADLEYLTEVLKLNSHSDKTCQTMSASLGNFDDLKSPRYRYQISTESNKSQTRC